MAPNTATTQEPTIDDFVVDKQLQKFAKKSKQPPHTYEIPGQGTLQAFIGDSINPHLFLNAAQKQLYKLFNDKSAETIKKMYNVTEEPLVISKQFMNGASEKLTNPQSPDYLPHKKVRYLIHRENSDHPTISIHAANEKNYNAIVLNRKDWENF